MRFAGISLPWTPWILCFVFGWPAAGSVCDAGDPREILSVEWIRAGRAAMDAPDPVSVQMTGMGVDARLWHRFPSPDTAKTLRLAHDYRAYDIPTTVVPLETNGHLHRLEVVFHERRESWEWAVGPILAVSSNAGRHPRVIDRDTVAWHGMVRRMHRLEGSVSAYWGACRDDRLGSRRLLPVLGLHWHLDDLEVAVGFPDSALKWQPHERWSVQVRAQPAGGSWRAFSDDLERRSRFTQTGWRFGVGAGFALTANHRLTASLVREVRRSFRFRLEDGSDERVDAADTRLVGVRLVWTR